MISNSLKLAILLTGNRKKESFWKDIRHYRDTLDMPPDGFRDQAHFNQWNSKWSDAEKDVYRLIPRSVALAWKISHVLVPRADFTVLNPIAEVLIQKYRLDSTYSTIKKLVEILVYAEVAIEAGDTIDQLVDFRYDGTQKPPSMNLVFTKHVRPQTFLVYFRDNRKVIWYFQSSLPEQKFPSFTATLNLKRQTVDVQLFRNTTPSHIEKNWHQIRALLKKLDEYTDRVKDPDTGLLLAVGNLKSDRMLRESVDKPRRRTLVDTLEILSNIKGEPVSVNYYKKCRGIVNRIKRPT